MYRSGDIFSGILKVRERKTVSGDLHQCFPALKEKDTVPALGRHRMIFVVIAVAAKILDHNYNLRFIQIPRESAAV